MCLWHLLFARERQGSQMKEEQRLWRDGSVAPGCDAGCVRGRIAAMGRTVPGQVKPPLFRAGGSSGACREEELGEVRSRFSEQVLCSVLDFE